MKLIDKDALVAEIKRRKELVSDPILSGNDLMIGERNAYYNLLSFIDTLEVKEVGDFFELGLNASNPITKVNLESLVRQVIDLYLEAGKHYNSVITEERKEYSGSDLAIKLLDGAIDAKELGIQYVLDKLKAQKGK